MNNLFVLLSAPSNPLSNASIPGGLNNFITISSIIILGYLLLYIGNLFYQTFLLKREAKTGVILEISLEKDSEQNPFAIEQLWSSFHGLYLPWYKRIFKPQPFFSFEIKSENTQRNKLKDITFNIWVPDEYKSFVRQKILSIYPYADIKVLKRDYIPTHEMTTEGGGLLKVETAELGLSSDSAFSLRTFEDFEKADPLNSVLAAMTDLENRELMVVQIVAQPVSYKWRQRAERVLVRFERTGKKPNNRPEWTNFFSGMLGWFFLIIDGFLNGLFARNPEFKDSKTSKTSLDGDRQKVMGEKTKRPPFSFQVRLLVATPYEQDAKPRIRNLIASFNEFEGPYNGLKKEVIVFKQNSLNRMRNRHLFILDTDDIITTQELAGLCHLPNKNMKTPGLKKIQSKKVEAPVNMGEDNPFAAAEFREGHQLIGLDEKARMRHIYVTGMTGVGKSTLLENMIINDIESGAGVVIIDPHGELVDEILHKVSAKREDIYVLDPSDLAYPFGMNLLEINSQDPLKRELEKVLVIDSYITIMKRVFGEASIGANTDDLFRMSCSAILDHPEGGGLMEMVLMLTSEQYRSRVIPYITDPIVKDYWAVTFAALVGDTRFQTQNLNAPLNKLRRFVANGLVANIICQKKSTLNIADAINSGAVILARFSRGDMGFENSALLGSMLIAKIQIAAMQRVNIPQDQRIPTYLYIDEFQNFIGDASGAKTFAEILSEARKYKLGLVIAHQFVEQLKQSGSNFLMEAIFNNCGTTITFRVGKTDAMFYEKVYYDADIKQGFKANDLANLGMGEVVMRVVTKSGIQSEPFSARTFPPVSASAEANPELVRKRSRLSICSTRDEIRKTIVDRMVFDTIPDA